MRSALPKPHSLAIVSPGRSGSFAANQVLSNEPQAIPTIQAVPKKSLFRGWRELWAI
jgi:hypothetical protein